MSKRKQINNFEIKSPEDFSFLKINYPKLHLKPTKTNIIISLTDANNKLIACHSAGSSGVIGTSRRKKAPQAVENIVKKMYPFFLSRNIKAVELIVNRKVTQATHYLVRELIYYGISIAAVRRRRISAHNGVRKPKIPRK